MSKNLAVVKKYLLDLNLNITHEDKAQELVVVEDEDNGIKNLVIDCEPPIVILEQLIMKVPKQPCDFFEKLLKVNRSLVHGAFVIDEEGKFIYFRDTLQLENLNLNELEGTIKALSLALAENAAFFLEYSKI